MVVPAKACDALGRTRILALRHGGQVERRGPAFGPRNQCLHGLHLEVEPGETKQVRRFGRGHRQIFHPDLDDGTVSLQPPDRQVRLNPTRQSQDRLRGQVAHHRIDEVSQEMWRDEMRVIENDDPAAGGLVARPDPIPQRSHIVVRAL